MSKAMGIVMDIDKKIFYDNLCLCRCVKCEKEFIIGETSIYDEKKLSCPICKGHSKIIAKTKNEELKNLELGVCTLTYIER